MPMKEEKKDEILFESKHNVYNPVAFRDIDKFFFTFKQRKIMRALLEKIDVNEFDLYHAHTLFTDGNVAYQLKQKTGIPYVVTVRGHSDIDGFFKKRINLRKRGREILKEASAVVFLSESNQQQLLKEYIKDEELAVEILEKSIIQPNGIDQFWFDNEGPAKELEAGQVLKVLFVGKFLRDKNAKATVEALNKLKERDGIESEFTAIGKIIDEKYLEEVLNIAEIPVEIVKPSPREELIDYYRSHDIFSMPSHTETFGLVYPEAMSQGLPVIYSKRQGFDGQFPDGYVGYPVESTSSEDLYAKLKLIMVDYEEISQNALKAYYRFNWDEISLKYIQVYKKIS